MASSDTGGSRRPAVAHPPPGTAAPAAGIDPAGDLARRAASARAFGTAGALLQDAVARRAPGGLVLEFGVYTGRSVNLIAERAPGETVYGFDSFAGLPDDWRPGFGRGAFATAPPAVRPNVRLVVGPFEDTLPAFLAAHAGPVSLMHVDCDLYSSTRTVLRLCRERIVAGTVVVFDEYFGYPGWEGHEHRAFAEFVAEAGRSFEYVSVVPGGEQVGVLITG
jgi:predicted O-methyltransferase YrrM